MPMGYFVSMDGLDKCGKSTQLDMLSSYLSSLSYRVKCTREPGGTPIGERIRDILLDKKDYGMDTITEMLLFNASRRELVTKVVKPYISDSFMAIVLADRFYDSLYAYQGYGRGIGFDALDSITNLVLQVGSHDKDTFIHPDLTILFDISVEESYRRRGTEAPDRIEQAGREFFEKVREGYHIIAKENSDRVIMLDGERPILDIHEDVKKILDKRIAEHRKQYRESHR